MGFPAHAYKEDSCCTNVRSRLCHSRAKVGPFEPTHVLPRAGLQCSRHLPRKLWPQPQELVLGKEGSSDYAQAKDIKGLLLHVKSPHTRFCACTFELWPLLSLVPSSTIFLGIFVRLWLPISNKACLWQT